MEKQHKKYKLIHEMANVVAITGLSIALATFSVSTPKENIPFTEYDRLSNITLSQELKTISECKKITFKNQELYEIIKKQVGKELDKETCLEITDIEIMDSLSNNDLSDLKNFPNLLKLTVYDNEVNFEDLKYNQNLFFLHVSNCTIKNTTYIPNSTDAIIIEHCKCPDKTFTVPYYTTNLFFKGSPFHNLTLKNPHSLEELYIIGNTILDLSSIKDCTNLKKINIELCSNISHPEVLTKLPSLEKVNLDDYASIWLTNDILRSIPVDEITADYLKTEIDYLDKIASSLRTKENMSDDELIANIIVYVLKKLRYDEGVLNAPESNIAAVHEYNLDPIKYSLNSDEGICINYACLFNALATRLNIETYQLFSTDHTWNIVREGKEFYGYDLTNLDELPLVRITEDKKLVVISDATVEEVISKGEGDIFYYYKFDLDKLVDELHTTDYNYEKLENTIINIGYINENSMLKLIAKGEQKTLILNRTMKIYIILTLINILSKCLHTNKIKDTNTLKKEFDELSS